MLAGGQQFNLSPTFNGRAFALRVTQVAADSVVLADTGPGPVAGGERQNFLRDAAPVFGVIAHQLYSATLGGSGQDHSQASAGDLSATLGSHHVTALWIESEATATAGFLNVPTSGKITVDGLMVDGQAVAITGAPNQTITFPDGFLVINEQSGSSSRHFGTLTVNALHLVVDGVGSMVAASSTAELISSPTSNSIY